VPRYVRLRPRPTLRGDPRIECGADIAGQGQSADRETTIEILNLRPNMSYGVTVDLFHDKAFLLTARVAH
jgi:hypothetical protein